MDLNLKDKIALVTGGSRSLGKAICLSLAAEGAKVVINYRRNPELARTLAEQIKTTYNTEAMPALADVSKEADVIAMFDQIEQDLGQTDILINNAAVCPTCPVHKMSEQVWKETIDVNLTGTFLTSRELVKRLLQADRKGRIVNIVSQAAFRGSTTGHAPYDASKGGIVSFTIALAREVAKKGICVNAVAPGIVKTDMMAPALAENEQKYLNRIPLHRIAEPQEIADIITFLASEKAAYMTGATVDVSGGMLMR
jgi:3-oxoacyl-[acyl-carrier protein] reductase